VNLLAFAEPFVALFMLIGIGALAARLGILHQDGVADLSALVVNVTLPASIFAAVAQDLSPAALASAPLVIALGVGLGAATWGLGQAAGRLHRLDDVRQPVYAFAAGCSNTGFLGIPLVSALLGPTALLTAVLYDFSTTIIIFTLGVAGLGRQSARLSFRGLLRNLLNPMFLALVFGVAWAATGMRLPSAVSRVLRLTGDATTPLAMIALGHMLYGARNEPPVPTAQLASLSAIRLLVAPLLMAGACTLLPLANEVRAVCVLQAGMPTAMLTAILAQQYGVDAHFGVRSAFATTLLALATLPLVMFGLTQLYGVS